MVTDRLIDGAPTRHYAPTVNTTASRATAHIIYIHGYCFVAENLDTNGDAT